MRQTDWLGADCLSAVCVNWRAPRPPAAEKARRPPCQGGQRSWPAFFTQVHRKRNPVQLLLSTSRRSRRLSSEKPRWHRAAGFLFCPHWQGGRRVVRGRGSNCFVQGLNLSVNCLQDTSEILPNLDISKSEELNSRGFNELLSGPVLLLLTS